MQKIMSQKEIEIKQKRNKRALGIFFIVLLVLSTAGFALTGISNSNNNAGTQSNEGQFNGQYWTYNLGGQEYYFSNNLDEINFESVEISRQISSYYGKSLYIDAENPEVLREVANNLGRLASRFQEACYGECERDLPEKDCSEKLIVWKNSGENKVYEEQNCVFIEGDLNAVDAFLYRVLGFN